MVTPTTGWAVEADGLVKSFSDTRAVDGVDLRVATGSVYGVLGPNGAGKTTTISMLATLARPDAGTARVFGHDVVREAQVVRQLIGLTSQFASLDEMLSGAENLVLFSRLQGLGRASARRKAAELLEEFGLRDVAKKPVTQYSGGMRRRLDLAASLIAQAPLIFLDEPTTGLDPRTRVQVWATIRRLVATGSTVLLTTQYLDEADQLCDRVAVIDQGRVVAEGTTSELKASVGQASLQLRLFEARDLEDASVAIERVLGTRPTISPEAGRLTAPMHDADRVTELLVTLREAGIRLAELSVAEPTLDEAFLALTGHGVEADATDDEASSDSASTLEGSRA